MVAVASLWINGDACTGVQNLLIWRLIQIDRIQSTADCHFIGSNDALQAAIPDPAVKAVQGWLSIGHRVFLIVQIQI
jgi:hypothetical protein